MNVNPYKVFKLPPDFTISQLKSRFKELASKYHPDRNPECDRKNNTSMYEMVKECYIKLLEMHNARMEAAKSDHSAQKKKFDLVKFNEVFESNRVNDAFTESGYDDWIRETNPEEFTGSGAIVHKREPEPLYMDIHGLGGTAFYELGVEKVKDFSGNTKLSLNFMDFWIAHSVSKLVDESHVKVPSYKSIDDITAERSQIRYTMSERDAERVRKMEEHKARKDLRRAEYQRQQDSLYEQQFKTVNKLLGVTT
jgi:hypothetical protein